MNKRIDFFLRRALLVAMSFSAFSANAYAPSVCESNAIIGYSNGIQTNYAEAEENADRLLKKIEETKYLINVGQKTVIFYHQKGRPGADSGGISRRLDVLEVYWLQAKALVDNDTEREELAMQVFHKAVQTNAGLSFSNLGARFYELLVTAENQAEADAFLEHTRENVDLEISEDVQELERIGANGEKLLLVAHSQGTLFANAALQRFTQLHPDQAKNVRLLSVGMAAHQVWQTPGGGIANEYVTSYMDSVINNLRELSMRRGLPAPAPSNSNVPETAEFGHGFISTYLNTAYEPGQKVMAAVGRAFAQFERDGPSANATLFTSEVDVDVGSWGLNALNSGSWIIEEGQQDIRSGFFSDQEDEGSVIGFASTTRQSPRVYRESMSMYCNAWPAQDFAQIEWPLGFSVPRNMAAPPSITGSIKVGEQQTVIDLRPPTMIVWANGDPDFPEYLYGRVFIERSGGVLKARAAPP